MFAIPLRTVLALAGVAAVLLAVHVVLKAEREKGRMQCQAEHIAASAKQERERTQAIAEIANEAQRMQARLNSGRVAAAVSADRLRGAVAGSGLVIRPAAAPASEATRDDSRVLSDLLERAVRLAAIADERGAAGAACERSYDSLR